MSTPKRYTLKWDETEIPDGEYVRAEDYDALERMRLATYLDFIARGEKIAALKAALHDVTRGGGHVPLAEIERIKWLLAK